MRPDLQPRGRSDDLRGMTIDEELIHDALLRSGASELDDILTTIEAYRTCIMTAHRLLRTRCMQEKRDQVLECAGFCRKVLEEFASTGRINSSRERESGETHFTFTLRSA